LLNRFIELRAADTPHPSQVRDADEHERNCDADSQYN
jgi:hypothetical protein